MLLTKLTQDNQHSKDSAAEGETPTLAAVAYSAVAQPVEEVVDDKNDTTPPHQSTDKADTDNDDKNDTDNKNEDATLLNKSFLMQKIDLAKTASDANEYLKQKAADFDGFLNDVNLGETPRVDRGMNKIDNDGNKKDETIAMDGTKASTANTKTSSNSKPAVTREELIGSIKDRKRGKNSSVKAIQSLNAVELKDIEMKKKSKMAIAKEKMSMRKVVGSSSGKKKAVGPEQTSSKIAAPMATALAEQGDDDDNDNLSLCNLSYVSSESAKAREKEKIARNKEKIKKVMDKKKSKGKERDDDMSKGEILKLLKSTRLLKGSSKKSKKETAAQDVRSVGSSYDDVQRLPANDDGGSKDSNETSTEAREGKSTRRKKLDKTDPILRDQSYGSALYQHSVKQILYPDADQYDDGVSKVTIEPAIHNDASSPVVSCDKGLTVELADDLKEFVSDVQKYYGSWKEGCSAIECKPCLPFGGVPRAAVVPNASNDAKPTLVKDVLAKGNDDAAHSATLWKSFEEQKMLLSTRVSPSNASPDPTVPTDPIKSSEDNVEVEAKLMPNITLEANTDNGIEVEPTSNANSEDVEDVVKKALDKARLAKLEKDRLLLEKMMRNSGEVPLYEL